MTPVLTSLIQFRFRWNCPIHTPCHLTGFLLLAIEANNFTNEMGSVIWPHPLGVWLTSCHWHTEGLGGGLLCPPLEEPTLILSTLAWMSSDHNLILSVNGTRVKQPVMEGTDYVDPNLALRTLRRVSLSFLSYIQYLFYLISFFVYLYSVVTTSFFWCSPAIKYLYLLYNAFAFNIVSVDFLCLFIFFHASS